MIAQQLLFGYERGHRLIAGSTVLSPDDVLRLQAATDTAGFSSFFISGTPLSTGQYGFSVTWPAPELPRPGAVWAHVLVLEAESLERLTDLSVLLSYARRPGSDAFEAFTQPVELEEFGRSLPVEADEDSVRQVMAAAYGRRRSSLLQIEDLDRATSALLAVWSQQWPALRRRFAFRTREISSDRHSDRVFTIARRVRGERPKASLVSAGEPHWLNELAADAIQPGELRLWLWKFGPTHAPSARNLVGLADVLVSAREEDRFAVLHKVTDRYPRPAAGRRLKQALYGSSREIWSLADELRIADVVSSGADVWDVDALDIAHRVALLGYRGSWAPVVDAWGREIVPTVSAALVAGFAQAASDDLLARMTLQNPEVAAEVARRAPFVLQAASFWRRLVSSGVITLGHLLGDVVDAATVAAIIRGGHASSVRVLVQDAAISMDKLMEAFDLPDGLSWGELHESLPPPPAPEPSTERGLIVLNAAYQWANDSACASCEKRLPLALESSRGMIDEAWLRSATQSMIVASVPSSRRQLLQVVFGPLHQAITTDRLPRDCWRQLGPALPEAADPAQRLRLFLIERIRDEKWSSEEVGRAIRDAGAYADLIRTEVASSDPLRDVLGGALDLAKWLKPW